MNNKELLPYDVILKEVFTHIATRSNPVNDSAVILEPSELGIQSLAQKINTRMKCRYSYVSKDLAIIMSRYGCNMRCKLDIRQFWNLMKDLTFGNRAFIRFAVRDYVIS